jgi:hypothetical protein
MNDITPFVAEPNLPRFPAGQFRRRFESARGRALWAFVNRPDSVARMEAFTELRQPALHALEAPLLREGVLQRKDDVKEAELDDWKLDKRMLGRMVCCVMREHGLVKTGTRDTPASELFTRLTFYSRANA